MSEQGILRGEIERSRAERPGRWHCPLALREQIAAYVRERRSAGAGLELIAAELGISESSASRWSLPQRPKATSKALLVEVGVATAQRAIGGLVVVTPRGYRLEGLSEGFALRLLREL